MRPISALLLGGFLCVGLVHCVGDEPTTPSTGSGSDGGGDGSGSRDDSSVTSDGAGGTVDVSGILNGHVDTGGPLPDRDVVIIDATGKVTQLTSGSDGSFHATGVVTPYDIYVPYHQPDGGVLAYPSYYEGVSRSDPSVYGNDFDDPSTVDQTPRTATISFNATNCTNCSIWLSMPGDGHLVSGIGSQKAYSGFELRWFGATPLPSTTVHAYYQDLTGAFTGHADQSSVTLNDGANTALSTLNTPIAITSSMLSVVAAIPGGYSFDNASIAFYDGDGSRVGYIDPATLTSSTPIPHVAGLRIDVAVNAKNAANEQAGSFTSYPDYTAVPASLSLGILASAAPVTPADAATGVDPASASLTWTEFGAPGVYTTEVGTDAGIDLYIQTPNERFDLSKLAKVGLDLGSGVTYNWHVSINSRIASMDDLAKPGGAPIPAPGTTSYSGYSVYRTFTTK